MVGGAKRYPISFDRAEVGEAFDAAGEAVSGVPVLDGVLDGFGRGAASGDVVIRDGVVVSIELRLDAGAEDAGQLVLTLDIDDHDDVPALGPPPGAVIVDAEDLADALVTLLEAGQGN